MIKKGLRRPATAGGAGAMAGADVSRDVSGDGEATWLRGLGFKASNVSANAKAHADDNQSRQRLKRPSTAPPRNRRQRALLVEHSEVGIA